MTDVELDARVTTLEEDVGGNSQNGKRHSSGSPWLLKFSNLAVSNEKEGESKNVKIK